MTGAIIYDSKYGVTEQYARWIGAATGLPVHSVADPEAMPERFDFVVLGSPVIYYKVIIGPWVRGHLDALLERPVIFFTVSGRPPGAMLDRWISDSLPRAFTDHMRYSYLRGRLDVQQVSWLDRIILTISGLLEKDRVTGYRKIHGFDFVDKASIAPIVAAVRGLQGAEAA